MNEVEKRVGWAFCLSVGFCWRCLLFCSLCLKEGEARSMMVITRLEEKLTRLFPLLFWVFPVADGRLHCFRRARKRGETESTDS